MAQAESFIEQKLIEQLTSGISQWTYRPDLNTEEKLWDNIRTKLNNANVSALNGHEITDQEMERIKDFIKNQGESAYKAAIWLSGENGLVQIPLKRDDVTQDVVYLEALNQKDIAGGHSTYEVINQCILFKTDKDGRDTRFDVTLLINGIPLIHIELKNQNHSYFEAFNQIKRYTGEGKFRGLFGLVQMFVISNGTETKYFSAAPFDKLSERFLFSWVDKNNNPVDNYLEFAKEVLKIPTAHEMIGRYAITDTDAKRLILLRPYQIHAIEAVKDASKRKESGYIWHTTGSGKTITSYNVARNLYENNDIEKTIFLIDRKDLDQQTTLSFLSYAKSTGDKIEETENTRALEQILRNKERTVVVATRQKLDRLLDKCETALKANDPKAHYFKVAKDLQNKRVAFIVDECHRAISPTAKERISKFFNKMNKTALWYGFTGTPIFAENSKAENGQAARTTQDQYGMCLHKYTIKEALHDRAVLGFQVQTTGFSRCELEIVADNLKIKNADNMERVDLERTILNTYRNQTGKNFYDSKEHREQVIDYIINHAIEVFGLKKPKGEAFAGILTCSSIDSAQKYYKEFKQFIADSKVREQVRRFCPDFPKFAITYSVGENEDGAYANQTMMKEALKDYNAMFHTNCSLENLGNYNADLNMRLARKHGKYKVREEQLDFVIVVDRLLTGFDAPCINSLFIDRPPMTPQGMIQAFSRTNRVFTESKKYGIIKTFQTPALYELEYNKALSLYSNGGSGYVSAPSFEESRDNLTKAVRSLKDFNDDPCKLDLNDQSNVNKIRQFVKLFQEFDRRLTAIKTYDEWDQAYNVSEEPSANTSTTPPSDPTNQLTQEEGAGVDYTSFVNGAMSETDHLGAAIKSLVGIDLNQTQIDDLTGKYNNAIEILRSITPIDPQSPVDKLNLDIEYHLDTISTTEVNYDYVVSVMQKYMTSAGDDVFIQINDPAMEKYITNIENRNHKLGEIIRGIWEELKANPQSFKGKQAVFVINDRIEEIINNKIQKFCNEWKTSISDLQYLANYYVPGQEVRVLTDFDAYRASGGTLNKLMYNKMIRDLSKQLIVEEILPLKNR